AGIVLFFVARTVSKGKIVSLFLSGLVALASLWYSLQLGRFGNLALTVIGLVWMYWLYGFRKTGELT
ncbi:MAG: hypothetical protein AB1750_16630, partial [Chloroflexota bacterium]